MKRVLLRGPALSKSGYGEHTRQIFRYLSTKKDIKIDVQNLHWGFTPWDLKREGIIGEIIDNCNFDASQKYDVTIQCQLPNEWDPSLGVFNIGVTAGVETDYCNPVWTSLHVDKMDKVIVPSNFTKNSLSSKVNPSTEIEVIPESFFEELNLEPESDVLEGKLSTDFNFLTVGVMTGNRPETDRKNLFYLIKWFIEEFKNDSDVGLVVKTNSGRDTQIDRVMTRNLLDSVLKELGHKGTPSIYFMHGSMSRKEMNSVYKSKKIKAYVSCTRGEGFGLPLLEAAAAGVPVLATDWSAHTEFLNLGKWISFKYSLDPVSPKKIDNNIFLEGMKWAEVKQEDFKLKLRTFYKKPTEPTKWAQELKKKILENYCQEKINQMYDEKLGEILS